MSVLGLACCCGLVFGFVCCCDLCLVSGVYLCGLVSCCGHVSGMIVCVLVICVFLRCRVLCLVCTCVRLRPPVRSGGLQCGFVAPQFGYVCFRVNFCYSDLHSLSLPIFWDAPVWPCAPPCMPACGVVYLHDTFFSYVLPCRLAVCSCLVQFEIALTRKHISAMVSGCRDKLVS